MAVSIGDANGFSLPHVCPGPDHLWYLSLRPRGVGEVDVRFGAVIAPEVHTSLDDPKAWLTETEAFFDMVNAEDRMVVEGIFVGAKAGLAAPGPLSWLEREIHDFQRYLARRLTDAQRSDVGTGTEPKTLAGDRASDGIF